MWGDLIDKEALASGDIRELRPGIVVAGLPVNRMTSDVCAEIMASLALRLEAMACMGAHVNKPVEVYNEIWNHARLSVARGSTGSWRKSGEFIFAKNDAGGWTVIMKYEL